MLTFLTFTHNFNAIRRPAIERVQIINQFESRPPPRLPFDRIPPPTRGEKSYSTCQHMPREHRRVPSRARSRHTVQWRCTPVVRYTFSVPILLLSAIINVFTYISGSASTEKGPQNGNQYPDTLVQLSPCVSRLFDRESGREFQRRLIPVLGSW